MRLPTPTRGAALVTGAALTAVFAAALVFASPGGPAAGATAGLTPAASGPTVTPVAAALVPGPVHLDRKGRSNVLTARLDFKPGDSTGWHYHPGPVVVQVVSGSLTLRHAAQGRCITEVVRAGHGFTEQPGVVHVAGNQRQDQAVVYATFILPPGAPPSVSAPIPRCLPLTVGQPLPPRTMNSLVNGRSSFAGWCGDRVGWGYGLSCSRSFLVSRSSM
jgi:quercetin dioxygenase-like cupin family protein